MKDIHSDMTVVSAIGAAVLSADNSPSAIDLQGYNAAEIVLAIGAGGITFSGTNKIEFVVTCVFRSFPDTDSSKPRTVISVITRQRFR